MSSETITTALFLITAVVAAGVLINAVYPVIYTMAGTFSTSTHESDIRIRTDFKIIATYASYNTEIAQIWMKNTGSERVSLDEIKRADVFCGGEGSFDHLTYSDTLAEKKWKTDFDPVIKDYDLNGNGYWDPGETIKITAKTSTIPESGNKVFFQFTLTNGIWRSIEFTSVS
jgi:flagellar protein FlaG